MRRLILQGKGETVWEDVADPVLTEPAGALVRPVAVATCDLDVGVLRGAFPLEGPYPFGHEGVAQVVEVGEEVATFCVGDLVVVPFQISCGACAPCRRGRTGNCASHPRMSTYGLGTMGGLEWGGFMADVVVVPHADAMLVPLPSGIDPVAVASASDNIPDGWRTVGPQLADEPGAEVLVVGGDGGPNSIGLYAAGLAVVLGSSRVVYLDDDPDRLGIASAFGADVIDGSPPRRAGTFPITVDVSGTPVGLQCALNSTAFDGTCSSASVYLTDPILPLFSMYSRCCTFRIGRAHVRPAIPSVLDLVVEGFNPALVTSAVVDWDDATSALADPPMKLVFNRPSSTPAPGG